MRPVKSIRQDLDRFGISVHVRTYMRAVRRLSRRRRARSPSSLLRMSALAIMGMAECVVSAYAVMQGFCIFPDVDIR